MIVTRTVVNTLDVVDVRLMLVVRGVQQMVDHVRKVRGVLECWRERHFFHVSIMPLKLREYHSYFSLINRARKSLENQRSNTQSIMT